MSNSYWESFKEQNKDSWHFDPGKKTQDYIYIGRLETDFQPLLDLMKDDKNFKEFIIASKNDEFPDNSTVNEKAQAFRDWGYNEYNTSSLQITDEQFPEIFEPYKKFAGFGECTVVALKQNPGQFLPWHHDTYVGFRKKFNVPDDVEVSRYSLFLEDWHWGHYFLCGNSVFHQWKQGDFVQMPLKMHHTTCNGGIVPKLSMTITGTVTDDFLQKKKNGKFEY
jgi:hypothetical protein|tara:strand:- start:27 stop:692 length:666 start_codon:yes stop_codon:yes gene_type:complete